MNTPYERIARTDDEPDFSAEVDWVRDRAQEIARAAATDHAKLKDAIITEMMIDYEDSFAYALASFFKVVSADSSFEVDADAAGQLWGDLTACIDRRLKRDARVAAQAEWDAKQSSRADLGDSE